MGCWNETDMITGLPILNGEPCHMVFLLKNLYTDAGYNACNTYVPVFSLSGFYDGYGDLLIERKKKELLNGIIPHLCYEDKIPYEWEEDSLEDIRYGNVFVKDHASGISQIRVVFLKQRTVDTALRCFAEYKNDALDQIKDTLATITNSRALSQFIVNWILKETINPIVTSVWICLWKTQKAQMQEQLLQLIPINWFLLKLRMAWHIPSGTGSQDGISDINHEFLQLYSLEVARLTNSSK